MNPNLNGQVALVTGAAKRIGREIALAIARQGANVIVHYNHSERDATQLGREITDLGVKSWLLKANFKNRDEYENLIPRAFKLSNRLDILVNNASIFTAANLTHLRITELFNILEINGWTPFYLSRAFAERVKTGKIVNLLDTRIFSLDRNHVGYTLSKQLLANLTEFCALEFAPKITVNAVAPGLILPPPEQPNNYLKAKQRSIPLKRHGHPSDISNAVVYLLGASFVTGTIIYVDGGQHLRDFTYG